MANETDQSLPRALGQPDNQRRPSRVSLAAAQTNSQALTSIAINRRKSWFGSLKAAFQTDTFGSKFVTHDARVPARSDVTIHDSATASGQPLSDKPSLTTQVRSSHRRSISAKDAMSALREHLPSTPGNSQPRRLLGSQNTHKKSSSELALHTNGNRRAQQNRAGRRHRLVNSITGSLRHIRSHSKQHNRDSASSGPEADMDSDHDSEFARDGINRPLPSSPIDIPLAPPRLNSLDFGYDRLVDLEFLGTPEGRAGLVRQAGRNSVQGSADLAASSALSISLPGQSCISPATYPECRSDDPKSDNTDHSNTVNLQLDTSAEPLPTIKRMSPLQKCLPFRLLHSDQLLSDLHGEYKTKTAGNQQPYAPEIGLTGDISRHLPAHRSGCLDTAQVSPRLSPPSGSEVLRHSTNDVNELDAVMSGLATCESLIAESQLALSPHFRIENPQRVDDIATDIVSSPNLIRAGDNCRSGRPDRMDCASTVEGSLKCFQKEADRQSSHCGESANAVPADLSRDLTPTHMRLELQAIRQALPELTRVEAHSSPTRVRSHSPQTERHPPLDKEELAGHDQLGRSTSPSTTSSISSKLSMVVEYNCSPRHQSASLQTSDYESLSSSDYGVTRLLRAVSTSCDPSEARLKIDELPVDVATVIKTNSETFNRAAFGAEDTSEIRSCSEVGNDCGYVRLPSTEHGTSSPNAFKPHRALYGQEAMNGRIAIHHAISQTASETSGMSPPAGPLTADQDALDGLSVSLWTSSSDGSSGGDLASMYDFRQSGETTAQIEGALLSDTERCTGSRAASSNVSDGPRSKLNHDVPLKENSTCQPIETSTPTPREVQDNQVSQPTGLATSYSTTDQERSQLGPTIEDILPKTMFGNGLAETIERRFQNGVEVWHVERQKTARLHSDDASDDVHTGIVRQGNHRFSISDNSSRSAGASEPTSGTVSGMSVPSRHARIQEQQVDAALQLAHDHAKIEDEYCRRMLEGLELSGKAYPVTQKQGGYRAAEVLERDDQPDRIAETADERSEVITTATDTSFAILDSRAKLMREMPAMQHAAITARNELGELLQGKTPTDTNLPKLTRRQVAGKTLLYASTQDPIAEQRDTVSDMTSEDSICTRSKLLHEIGSSTAKAPPQYSRLACRTTQDNEAPTQSPNGSKGMGDMTMINDTSAASGSLSEW